MRTKVSLYALAVLAGSALSIYLTSMEPYQKGGAYHLVTAMPQEDNGAIWDMEEWKVDSRIANLEGVAEGDVWVGHEKTESAMPIETAPPYEDEAPSDHPNVIDSPKEQTETPTPNRVAEYETKESTQKATNEPKKEGREIKSDDVKVERTSEPQKTKNSDTNKTSQNSEPIVKTNKNPANKGAKSSKKTETVKRGNISVQKEDLTFISREQLSSIRSNIAKRIKNFHKNLSYSTNLEHAAVLRARKEGKNGLSILTQYGGQGWKSAAWGETSGYAYTVSFDEDELRKVSETVYGTFSSSVLANKSYRRFGIGIHVTKENACKLTVAILLTD